MMFLAHAAFQEVYKVRRPRRLVAASVFWSRSSNKSSWPQRNWVATTGGSQGESAWNGWGGVGSTCNAQTTILVDLVKGIKSLDIFSYIVSHSIKEILVQTEPDIACPFMIQTFLPLIPTNCRKKHRCTKCIRITVSRFHAAKQANFQDYCLKELTKNFPTSLRVERLKGARGRKGSDDIEAHRGSVALDSFALAGIEKESQADWKEAMWQCKFARLFL